MEIFKMYNQQDNCQNGITEHGVTSKNEVSGTDKRSVSGEYCYHSHLPDVFGECFTVGS